MSKISEKLLSIQEEIKPIEKDATNPYYNSKYFDINTLLAELKPILTKHGLVLNQPLLVLTDGKNALKTRLEDVESGESIESLVCLPEGLDAQKMGGAITYLRRYSLQSLLALEAVDDDANGTIQGTSLKPKYDYTNKKDLSPEQFGGPKKDPLAKKEPKHKDIAKDDAEHDTNQDLNI